MLELIKKHIRKALGFSDEDVERQSILTNLITLLGRDKLEKHKDFIKSISNEELRYLAWRIQCNV